MLGKSKNQNQGSFFKTYLKDFIDEAHPLVILGDSFPWKALEDGFAPLYSHTGTPSKPVRLMVGLLILKQLHGLGDETLMGAWVQNPYFQYFCGEAEFQWRPPCDPSDLVHFRKRIGTKGVEKILELSIAIQHPEDLKSRDVIVDSTVQEKNITYPTDAKLYRKIIDKSNIIAQNEELIQRRTYTREVKKLKTMVRFGGHPNQKKVAKKAVKRLKTIAGRQVRELRRILSPEALIEYKDKLEIFEKVLNQERGDKNKIYSLHELDVACIAKGKAHKKFEFGSKVSFGMLPGSNIIVAVKTFKGNPHDSKTLEPTLEMCREMTGKTYKNVIVDRGYRGKKQIGETKVILPMAREKTKSKAQTKRKKCRQRAAIEPTIGHIKHYCGMGRNYLKGIIGDEINAILSATAFNLKHLLNRIAKEGRNLFLFLFWDNNKVYLLTC